MTPDQIVSQFQQILSTMQRMIAASADLATRVEALEQASGEISGRLTHIDGSVQLLLDNVQGAGEKQIAAYGDLARRLARLESRMPEPEEDPDSEHRV